MASNMLFHLPTAEVFVPDGLPAKQALARTTHLGVGAHPDYLEIMAVTPILECFERSDQWFTAVVLTSGRGSPRLGDYKNYSEEKMRRLRLEEQRKAAIIGKYGALVMLDYPSAAVQDGANMHPIQDLAVILRAAQPIQVFTHNLADKHDTHVAAALKVIAAIRSLPVAQRPHQLFGCEAWRSLDWMLDQDKLIFDLSSHEELQSGLIGVFDSQIKGGKRYDQAASGRRRANATYLDPNTADVATGLEYAMDLTPLILSPELKIASYMQEYIRHFAQDVADRLARLI
jgi:LmbE family N-acetylglucosaminyl deacetylase